MLRIKNIRTLSSDAYIKCKSLTLNNFLKINIFNRFKNIII